MTVPRPHMDDESQELTSLVGREVYTNNGVYVGEVEDLRLDMDAEAVTGLALNEVNTTLFEGVVGRRQGVLVPYRWVRSVGDIVLISDTVERLGSDESEEAPA